MLPNIRWPDNLSAERFIAEYWQRKPVLFRAAFPAFDNPLPADELAGLACDENASSRLIIESRGARPWELRQGPLEPDVFDWLGQEGWSLLVTDLEKILPDFRDALEPFRFIPDWRIDDLMASFAPPGGSVGAHYDEYDVFLLQVEGRRRWLTGPEPPGGYVLVEGVDIKVIDQPTFDADHVLEPGDMLYVPPRWAHHGIALDPCITWSIGFRAPQQSELISAWADTCASERTAEQLYTDPDFSPPSHPGEITAEARARLRDTVMSALQNDSQFDAFIGQFLTDRAADFETQASHFDREQLKRIARAGRGIERHPAIRFAFFDVEDHATLFAGGLAFTTHPGAARAVCQSVRWQGESLDRLLDEDGAVELLIALGALGFVEEMADDD